MKRFWFLALAAALAGCGESPTTVVPQVRPVEGGWVSSSFGPRPVHPIKGATPGGQHDGYDFAVPTGSPIRASMAGTVGYVGSLGGYGQAVVVNHANGYSTLYGHASKLGVKVGQRVGQGDVIALVGSTGLSTGPHLHYELRRHGVAIDPGAFSEAATVQHVAAIDKPIARKLTARAHAPAKPKATKQAPARKAAKSGRAPARPGS